MFALHQGGSSAWDSEEEEADTLDIPVILCETLEMTESQIPSQKNDTTQVLRLCAVNCPSHSSLTLQCLNHLLFFYIIASDDKRNPTKFLHIHLWGTDSLIKLVHNVCVEVFTVVC